jgi:hypothetical protein
MISFDQVIKGSHCLPTEMNEFPHMLNEITVGVIKRFGWLLKNLRKGAWQ